MQNRVGEIKEKERDAYGKIDQFWTDRPVVVTGASGFLGGWLVKRLIALGAMVVCPLRDWVPDSLLVKDNLASSAVLVRGDIQDQFFMERIFGEYEIKTIFHLAAQTIVSIANRNPLSTFESNIRGTWSLLEACRRSPAVEQVVVASSDKAYGEQDILPYHENMPLHGRYPYDVSKACADMLARSYFHTYELPVTITRCGNFFGGGDLNWNRIIPGTIRSVLRGENPVIRSDGKFVRDYFYIEDGAAAYLLLAEKMAEKPQICGEVFNFASNNRLSVLAVVNKVLHLMEVGLKPQILSDVSGEIGEQYLSAEKAKKILGWQPLFELDEALQRTILWYRDYLRGKRCKREGGSLT